MKSLITCLVAGAGYLIHPQKLGAIEETINPDSIIPVTLLSTDEIFGDVEAVLNFFGAVDDVFVPDFGFVLVEKPGSNSSDATPELASLGNRQIYRLGSMQALDEMKDLPSGPYFLHGPNLHQAWKLFDDTAEAFVFGVIPEDVHKPSQFRALNALSVDGTNKAVPVPSRLYHSPPHDELPLSGLRVSIDDAFSLQGVRTTLSSRAWSSFYTAASHSTASLVKRLLEMGAVVVGKTKTSQLGVGSDWVDALMPWNPRGDGYQGSGGVSAGSSAALSTYDWLEHSFGSQVIGGIPHDASFHGVYSLQSPNNFSRINHDASSYDSVELSSRSLTGLLSLINPVFSLDKSVLPEKLVLPLDFLSSSNGTMDNKFVAVIENFLGIKAEPVNMTDLWAKKPPAESDGLTLQEYVGEAPFLVFCYNLYHRYKDFMSDYQEAFDRAPFVEKTVQYELNIGRDVSQSDYQEYTRRLGIFRAWFDKHVMALENSSNILVLPCTAPTAYRDAQSSPSRIRGLTPELLPIILQAPHLTVPFAQLPYESSVTAATEYRPVSGSVMGSIGGELMLIETVKGALELATWRTRVDTGRLAFPIGDNERHVDDQHIKATESPVSQQALEAAQEPPEMGEL